jgi:hypothetical protein
VWVLLGERLNKFLRPDVGQTLQFDVGQLLCQEGGAWTQLSDVSLKQKQRASFWARCYCTTSQSERPVSEQHVTATFPLNVSTPTEKPAGNTLM